MKALALLALAATPAALALLDREKHLLSPPAPKQAARRQLLADDVHALGRRQLNGTGLETATVSGLTLTEEATPTTGFATATAATRTATGSSATAPSPTSTTGGGDPCAIFDSSVRGTLFEVSEVRNCIRSVPLDTQTKANTLEVVSKMYNLAIFEYHQLDWPSPLAQKVDIRAELSRMESQSYESDYDFALDLGRTFDSLYDGHHYWSDCYGSSFVSFIPFPPVSFVDDPTSTDPGKIYVAPDAEEIMTQYEQYFYIEDFYNGLGLNASFLAGKEITAINGKDPWTAIDEIADAEGGTYQSLQARRTNALAGRSLVGITTARTLGTVAQQTWPERESITYTIDGQDYVIPYVARDVSEYSFSTADEFHSNNCLVYSSSSSSSSNSAAGTGALAAAQKPKSHITPETAHPLALFPDRVATGAESKKRGWRGAVQEKRQSSYSSCGSPGEPYLALATDPRTNSAYVGGRDVQFYVLPANSSGGSPVGVVWLATFSPDTDCTDQFITDTNEGFANFSSAGVEDIIIDTTGNGGGSIALNIIWQSLFAGSSFANDLNFASVLRGGALPQKLLNAHTTGSTYLDEGYYGPEQYRTADGSSYLSGKDDYFKNGADLTVNGKSLEVSSVLRDSTPESYLSTSSSGIFAPANVLIFGDGLCGSACASWASFLTRYLNVSTAVVHPRPGEQTEFQQFEAGQAVTSTAIYSELELTNLANDADAPPALLSLATFGFAFRGHLVPGTTDQFIQYASSPAGSTFGMTAEFYNDPIALWQYVAANGPLSSSPKLATTGQSTGGGAAAGTSNGNSTAGGSGSGGSGGGSAAFARVDGVKGVVVLGAAALATLTLF